MRATQESLLTRITNKCLPVCTAVLLSAALQVVGLLKYPPTPRWMTKLPALPDIFQGIAASLWPMCFAGLAFVTLTPKANARPKIPKKRGIACGYGELTWDRNNACRGWLITGATGKGKTECGINLLMHSFSVNEAGRERPTWRASQTKKQLDLARQKFLKASEHLIIEAEELRRKINKARSERREALDAVLASDIAHHLKLEDTDSATVIEKLPPHLPEADKVAHLQVEIDRMESAQDEILYKVHTKRMELQKFTDRAKELQYEVYPWGGICCDEKGDYWQILQGMMLYYERDHDLMLLQTKPVWAGPSWEPPARFNLLSDYSIPPDTYAKLILDTAESVTGSKGKGGGDVFFTTQAVIQIGWAIKLLRAMRAEQIRRKFPADQLVNPSITNCLTLLAVKKDYDAFLTSYSAMEREVSEPVWDEGTGKRQLRKKLVQPSLTSSDIQKARHSLEVDYWQQPDDQRGGVSSTIYNYLNFFTEPEIADVYCSDNTFDFRDVAKGKILCISMPQKFSLQRRYVAIILKNLFYQFAKSRFDQKAGTDEKIHRNMLILWQDESQRFFIDEDGNVDILRSAEVTTVMAAQTQDALIQSLGDEKRARVVLSNLRNRIVFGAALETCAEETSKIIGKMDKYDHSVSSQEHGGGSVSQQVKEDYILRPQALMNTPDFHCYVVQASGKRVFSYYCAQPITPDGRIPPWWFGSYNPRVWLRYWKGDDRATPWWKGKAPFRVRVRHHLGFDTTFTQLRVVNRDDIRMLKK